MTIRTAVSIVATHRRDVMSNVVIHPALPALLVTLAAAASAGCGLSSEGEAQAAERSANPALTPALIAEGQQIFRYDTFGDEQLWTAARACTRWARRSLRSPRSRSGSRPIRRRCRRASSKPRTYGLRRVRNETFYTTAAPPLAKSSRP